MGTEAGVDMNEFQAGLAAKIEASYDAEAATGDAKPADAAVESDETEPVDGETGTDGEVEGQPSAKQDDPWAEFKSKYKPEQLREALQTAEKAREIEENAKAMRREASLRNEGVSRDKAALEDLRRKVEMGLESQNAFVRTIASLAQDGNEEHAIAMMKIAAKEAAVGAQESAPGRAPMRAGSLDPEVVRLREELAALREQQNQVVFGMNHRDVQQSVMRAASRHDFLSKPHVQKLGISERVIQEAVAAIYQKDKLARERGEAGINPWAPGAIDREAEEAFAAAIAPWASLAKEEVTYYRTERKKLNAQAPPSSKGASAGVRSAPNLKQPNLPKNATAEDFQKNLAERMRLASEAARPTG